MNGMKTLLIVDAQVAMVDEEPPLTNRDAVMANLKDLLSRARGSDMPVVFVQHIDAQYEPMQPGKPGFEVHPDIAPLPGEASVHKRACDSFYQTDLEVVLQGFGAETLIIGGFQTELCIDSTCRSATSHGYNVVLVADGHSTWDSPALTGQQIIDHHNATLAALAHPGRDVVAKPAAAINLCMPLC